MICGLPGSGKSTFARAYFQQSGYKRVNRNEIRRMLHSMTTFGQRWRADLFDEGEETLVKHVERRIIEHLLHEGERVVIDNTSVTAESRRNYVTMAERMRRRVGVIFLNTPVGTCLERNQSHEDHIPDSIVSNLYAAIELPSRSEGFLEVLVVE